MTTAVAASLQPRALWAHFEQLSAIPRPSFHEERVLGWLKDFASERTLKWRQDDAGNLVIYRGGMNGGETAKPVVIQGHVDMVGEKNDDTTHDFMSDPIKLRIQDGWLRACGTTLGADNGIGVAAALALLDTQEASGTRLPPLECLFTVTEEVGLQGAAKLDPSLLTGRTMLNLDTEEWGSIYIGCAGGGDSTITMPAPREIEAPAGLEPHVLRIDGLRGGHSGICIHENRGNALLMLASLLDEILPADAGSSSGAALVSLKGGDKRNAIPREAQAVLLLTPAAAEMASELVVSRLHDWSVEYGAAEQGLSAVLRRAVPASDPPLPPPLTAEGARKLVALLLLLPNGVMKWSFAMKGLVETSSNLAAVAPAPDGSIAVLCSTRSSLGHALEGTRRRIKAAAELCGATAVAQPPAYPGWQPQLNSPVLAMTEKAARRVMQAEPKKEAIHAGLECGVIKQRVEGMDVVSFGPTIHGAHSPDEMVEIATVGPFWRLVLLTLHGLAGGDIDTAEL